MSLATSLTALLSELRFGLFEFVGKGLGAILEDGDGTDGTLMSVSS
jgi:hypothetical protein